MPASNATLGNTQIAQLKPFCPAQRPNVQFFRLLQRSQIGKTQQTRYITVHRAIKNPSFFIRGADGN